MKTVLLVAEKPSLAASIAGILSGNQQMSFRKGAAPVYEYSGEFKGEKVHMKFTSVMGHVLSLDFTAQYNNWETTKPVELFGADTKKIEDGKSRIGKHLESEGRGCDYLVLWLDCDREGENICFEVIKFVKKGSPGLRNENIYRSKFSAITAPEIKKAMGSLIRPNLNESLSVDARQELDLRIGCAFTRFQTRFFNGKYGDLDSNCISYGPCLSPTLAFCVERHDKIQSFEPEKYASLSVYVKATEKSSEFGPLEWKRGRCFDRNLALVYLDLVKKNGAQAKVLKVDKKEKSKARPTGLNTVNMMKTASASLSMSPKDCMHLAERLYMSGYISYPRTETTHYDKTFDLVRGMFTC